MIKNIQLWLSIGAVIAFSALTIWNVNLRSDNHKLKAQRDMARQELETCQQDVTLSEENSYGYQKKISDMRRRLSDLERVRDNAVCVPITRENGTSDGSPTERKLSGRSGLTDRYLYDLAGRCEETRIKLEGCQDFVSQLYKSRGH